MCFVFQQDEYPADRFLVGALDQLHELALVRIFYAFPVALLELLFIEVYQLVVFQCASSFGSCPPGVRRQTPTRRALLGAD